MSTINANTINNASGAGGVDIQGTNTNDAAASGYIGQEVISTLLVGSAVSLTTTVAANITSIDIPAGDWELDGDIVFSFAGTPSYVNASVNTVSATLPSADTPVNGVINTGHNTALNTINEHAFIPNMRVSL